jgi:uncharacterized membrane protein
MEGVEEVRQLDDRRLHWVAEFGGERHECDAEIVEQHAEERVAWRNTDGKDNAGVVTFHKIDDEGLTALTMRRLGAELGVEAMSLYRHPGKEALLDGIVELIVLEIDVPVDADGDWEDAARFVARSFRLTRRASRRATPAKPSA